MPDDAEQPKPLSPPYVAYSTTKTLLTSLKANGVPARIDRSVLGNFSGQVGGQLITALRFLKLIDANGHPTGPLPNLVASIGSDDWPITLHQVLSEAYRPLMESNLANSTSSQFNDRFKELYPGEGETTRKCMTFFLSAAKEAGVAISPYIMKNKKPRSAPTKRRPKAVKEAEAPATQKGGETNVRDKASAPNPQPQAKTPEQMLFDLLHPDMTPEEQQAVFALLLYVKKSQPAQPKQGGGQNQ